ncbi:MAG: hypothetical protein K9K67_04010 [Bacteriovoracaceae bacterium]|nr:hypothetical protein [Bacteriovoracaceae bacterium]
MAVKRPNFSRKVTVVKAPLGKQKTANPALRLKKKRGTKPLRYFLYLVLLGLLFLESGWPPGRGIKTTQAQESAEISYGLEEEENEFERQPIAPIGHSDEAKTTILGEVGLSGDQMRVVAENILAVAKASSEEFSVADGLSLSMYVLRYLAEIGEYELAYKDIMILIRAFEKLSGDEVSEQVIAIVEQLEKIRFGKREGKYFSQFFSKTPQRGIIIPIDERSEDPNSSLREIKRIVAVEGSVLYFNEIDNTSEKREVRDFIKTPVKILNVIESVVKALNQVHPDIIQGIDDYLERNDHPAPPMIIDMAGISIEVDTTTIFKDITFDFNKAYVFPGLKLGTNPLPTVVLGAKAKLLNLKVSVDQ